MKLSKFFTGCAIVSALALLCIAAVTPVQSLLLQGDANGGQKNWTNVFQYVGTQLILDTNRLTSGGSKLGTNDARGTGSIFSGHLHSTNAFNVQTEPESLFIGSAGGTSDNFSTNEMISTVGNNILVSFNVDQLSGNRTNVVSINSSTTASQLLHSHDATKGAPKGIKNQLTSTSATLSTGFLSPPSENTVLNTAGTISAARIFGGSTNYISGDVGSIHSTSATGIIGRTNNQGAVSAFNGGGINLNNALGSIFAGTSAGSYTASGDGSIGAAAVDAGGTFIESNNGNLSAGHIASGHTFRNAALGGVLLGASDGYGSAEVTGLGSFQWGAGYSNGYPARAMFGYGTGPTLTVTTNSVGVGTNNPTTGYAFETVGNAHIAGTLDVDLLVNAAHGTLAMGTGTVSVATSASTNIVANIWNYVFTDSPVGVETNTSLVLTNGGHVFISFGAAISSNASGAGNCSVHIYTNHVPCTVLRIESTAAGATTFETGFKEFAVSLPANCRVTMYVGQTAAQSVSLKNLCLNIKGAN